MIMLSNIGWKSGLREWVLQRLTAVYITIYIFYVFFYLVLYGLNYYSFLNLFGSFYFKLLTIFFVFNLVLHSSIGMNIIINDYVKNTLIRIMLDFLINSFLLIYVFFIMQVLWSLK